MSLLVTYGFGTGGSPSAVVTAGFLGGTPTPPPTDPVLSYLAARLGRPSFSAVGMYRGEDRGFVFTELSGADLSGASITWSLATSWGGTVLLAKSATVLSTSRFEVLLASSETASLTPGKYVWDCRREDSGGKATLAFGLLFVKREVTA